MSLEDYEKEVVEKASKILKKENPKGWCGQICMDTVASSMKEGKTIEEAVQTAIDDTLYWDGCYSLGNK